ncbi:MAG: fluoride efflux transporter CrcB [Proteobacteria bacterium]|nr:MAG: fluoride efflux transporter CrcB [Pseudomonadota bacterium]
MVLGAVFGGAGVGAVVRQFLNERFAATSTTLHWGTLAANLIGGYLVGLAAGWFAQRPLLAPEWRLLAITGFLGGLTTFSAFSLELAGDVNQGRAGTALALVAVQVGGSLVLTLLGLWSARFLPA